MLVEITPQRVNCELALAYATSDNFTGAPVYAKARCFLHQDAADLLARSAELAARHGLRLRIFDAFRPTEAQWRLWEHTPDPEFLADPRRGSPHSRGVAVDLTLIDKEGRALDMGTPFDDFTSASHHGAPGLSPEVERNRYLLLGIMTTAGWDFYRNEWWHYQLFNPRSYPLWSDAAAGTEMM